MKFLVTGGAGFIGSSLVDRTLAGGHEVDIVDDLRSGTIGNLADARAEASGRLKIHQLDVRDPALTELLERRRPEVVYHLATDTDRSGDVTPSASAALDVAGTVSVLDAALAAGVDKIVLASSARARAGTTTRCRTRCYVDDLAVHYREAHGLEHTIVVLPTVFGPRQRPSRESSVVATFAERLVHRQPCVVHGAGDQTRDLLYIDDAVDALVKSATAADGLSVDVGSGRQTSIRSLHAALAAMVGVDDAPVPGAARDGEPGSVDIDPTRAELYLGWSPFTPLAEGLTDAVVALDR